MVFVAVGKNDPAHPLAILDQVGDLRNYDVDAQQLRFWKHQPGVDDNDVISPSQGHAVHAELAKSAQGDDLQLAGSHGGCALILAHENHCSGPSKAAEFAWVDADWRGTIFLTPR